MGMELNKIAELLEEAAQDADDWHAIGAALRKQDLRTHDHPLWIFVYAFEYMFVEKTNVDYRARYGPFAPWIEMSKGVFPPPLTSISKESLFLWEDVFKISRHPVVRSRLADLLWLGKHGNRPDSFAREAIDAYLQVSKSLWKEIDRAICLIRALELAREIRDTERKALTIKEIVDAAKQELNSVEKRPGVSMRLIEALMDLPPNDIPEDLDGLLELAKQVYSDEAITVENVLELMAKRADPERQKELRKEQINRWLEEAKKNREKGLLHLMQLQHALELARNYGFKETAEEIRIRIQSVPEDELDLSTISAEVKIPKEKIETYLNSFVHEKGWPESLMLFGSHGPPSGNYEKNVDSIKQRSPLKFLVTNVILDENNVPIQIGRDFKENMEIAVVQQETIGIRIFGNLAPEILHRIVDKHGVPNVDELTQFFATELIPPDISENIARAVSWYFRDEYDIAAHLLVPRIEAIFRNISRTMGLAIIREPVGNTPGGVIQLGKLLDELKGRLDESWRRYFCNLLVNPIGVNLRNRICHGLLAKATKEETALLIHVACHLSLLQIQKSSEGLPEDE